MWPPLSTPPRLRSSISSPAPPPAMESLCIHPHAAIPTYSQTTRHTHTGTSTNVHTYLNLHTSTRVHTVRHGPQWAHYRCAYICELAYKCTRAYSQAWSTTALSMRTPLLQRRYQSGPRFWPMLKAFSCSGCTVQRVTTTQDGDSNFVTDARFDAVSF